MPEPLVSVVIPVFNGERFLAQAVESALGQTYRRTEVIVVDDGSTDRSRNVAGAYSVIFVRQENRGISAARNRGLATAGGELIAFLDQDDLWLPHKLERQVQCLLDSPEADICVCEMRALLEPGYDPPAWMDAEWRGRSHTTTQLGTLLATRAAFDRVGNFDASYFSQSDTDWLLRARDVGVGIAMLREPLTLYRVHAGSITAIAGGTRRETVRAFHRSIKRKRARP